jgi:feruloyl esterase
VNTAQTIISPATDAAGRVYFPRLEPGTELAWARLAGGPEPAPLFWDQFRYVVYHDPNWDWRSFDLARDAAKANAVNKDIDELDPHLAPFAKHGGKLLLYHGWADQQVAPAQALNSINRPHRQVEILLRQQTGFGSSWFPAWDITAAEKAPTHSTRSA